ncbi:phosphoribosylanthranilate isomerase [Paenibacillus hamazuiensis]|uniref:phosphoribosylanthranilate isomerase n=1 Tax=Paenibacillus hamazuiensis TaxID=2936508 RepID=UPI00200FAFCC|nr:phosphoribosylanthranilate isomerase [Paenibacillus hamazuiensis]
MAATVKICGLMMPQTIRSIAQLPIDHIGFIFAKSRRQVTPEQVGEMIRTYRGERPDGTPLMFGVFVNPSFEQLEMTLAEAPLDVVQLHGEETPEFCRKVKETLGVKVYKVFSVTEETGSSPREQLEIYLGSIDGILLDTAGGGTGKTFDWERIPDYLPVTREAGIPLIVAGGLHADNVAELLSRYRPDGVDISSGVETDGVKDVSKITTFVERVKACV